MIDPRSRSPGRYRGPVGWHRATLRAVAASVAVCAAGTACGTSAVRGTDVASPARFSTASTAPSLSSSAPSPSSSVRSPIARTASASSTPPRTSAAPASSSATSTLPRPPGTGPVVVIDPGHSPTITATDPATGLNVSDYENEPEMRDVFAVAELVRTKLIAAGYRVVMTKTSVADRVSLGERAAIANRVHAALALSIHDQAGPNGGIGFDQGNAITYYQTVGTYRETPSGRKVYFTDSRIAALSRKYGAIFQAQRTSVEQHSVRLQGDVGYDLGSRGLAPGNIWLVQLLSHVPWIYNEAGGNSAGTSGLDATDKARYANGLVAAVEHCVPPQ